MGHMWQYRLKSHWREISAAIIVIAAVLLVFLAIRSSANSAGVTLLGDAAAPRPTAAYRPQATLPRAVDEDMAALANTLPSSVLDNPPPPSDDLQSVAAARSSWSDKEIQQRQAEVLTAVNCARQQHSQPPLQIDPGLSQTAAEAWMALARNPGMGLESIPGDYSMRGLLSLQFAAPEQAAQRAPAAARASSCDVGGFDPATLPLPDTATLIGIAVFPPRAPGGWDGASAVIFVK